MSVTEETSQAERSPLKADPVNIPVMSVTEETFQVERLPLNEAASANIHDMSVTRERSGSSVAI